MSTTDLTVAEIGHVEQLLVRIGRERQPVYSATYFQTAQGPSLLSIAVVDPWPFNPRVHNLTLSEMVPRELGGEMTFLADIRIS